MTLLSTITNEAINENLKARFNNQEIYVSSVGDSSDVKTYIAHVLISVNPFRGRPGVGLTHTRPRHLY